MPNRSPISVDTPAFALSEGEKAPNNRPEEGHVSAAEPAVLAHANNDQPQSPRRRARRPALNRSDPLYGWHPMVEVNVAEFPLGARVRLEQLERDPHALLARLREREPVSWLPALGGWLVTRHDLALQAMRDGETFTVDDPRFTTAQVVGQSMLSLDGHAHTIHRAPFIGPFRAPSVRVQFGDVVAEETARLLDGLPAEGAVELRTSFVAPLAAVVVTHALGLDRSEAADVLAWYGSIVAAVTDLTAGGEIGSSGREAFASLSTRLERVIDRGAPDSLLASAAADGKLTRGQVISNAAVLVFGGIETTEGMIANAVLALLEHPAELERARADEAMISAAIEESLRLEPAAAVIDRYATADTELGGARIAAGDLVRLSISAVNRDPEVFSEPDRFDLTRTNARLHLAFARGPHVCIGVHLARLEAQTALTELLRRFPRLRLDGDRPATVRGLVFRKPPTLHVAWG
jgi:cytochrome P450